MLQNSDLLYRYYFRKLFKKVHAAFIFFSLSFCDGICEDYIPLTDVIVKFNYVVVYRDNGILGYSYRLGD